MANDVEELMQKLGSEDWTSIDTCVCCNTARFNYIIVEIMT